MKKLILLLGVLILTVSSYGMASEKVAPVTVVNTPSNPVPVTGIVSTTVLASASNFTIQGDPNADLPPTAVISGIDVSRCDRIRFSISVHPSSGSPDTDPRPNIICLMYDPLTQTPLDSTPPVHVWTTVLQPLTQFVSVQCSAQGVNGVPDSANVSCALCCR